MPFVANSAAEALARIQAQMGPEAVVLNVRQLPVNGLARLWKKPLIEVLACPPGLFRGAEAAETSPTDAAFPAPSDLAIPHEPSPSSWQQQGVSSGMEGLDLAGGLRPSRWKVSRLLSTAGLIPLLAQKVIDDLEMHHGVEPPATLPEEIQLLRETLRQLWNVAGPIQSHRPQVLIGAPGSGKTTLLCKWMTKSVLMENCPARVFRLDGVTANTGEMLEVHAEILGVPVSRMAPGSSNSTSAGWQLVDIPGVDWRDRQAIGDLRRVLDKISGAEVHLVLNGAYEVSVLLAQIRAFSSLPLSGLMITHLDEDQRWGKLWNLVLGSPLAVRFLSAGQSVPGEFLEATPERLNDRWLGSR